MKEVNPDTPQGQQLVEDFVAGNLSGTALDHFEEQLVTDPALREAVELEKDTNLLIRYEGRMDLRDRLKSIHTAQEKNANVQEPEQEPEKDSFNWVYFAVAAVIAVLMGVFIWQLSGSSPESVFEEFYSPYPNRLTVQSGGNGEFSRRVSDAMTMYDRANYAQAEEVLDSLAEIAPERPELQLYAGICSLELKDYESAEAKFESVKESGGAWQEPGAWYHALTLIARGKTVEAKSALSQIIADESSYAEKADAALINL